MAQLIYGKEVAASVYDSLQPRIEALKARGVQPSLTVILVGEDPASQVYVRNKARMCKKLGMASQVIRMPEETAQEELLAVIEKLNADPSVHGILVQMPVPKQISSRVILEAIDPKKDVDGFHPFNTGKLFNGSRSFVACTPKGVMRMLESAGIDPDGLHAVVVGRSNIVGKPMAALLLDANCTVTVCHTHTRNLAEICREADLLVATVGKPRLITADMVKDGAIVIDVGINRLEDGSLCGDVDFDEIEKKASWITPVPGGVGPMTIAMLMENTVEAAEHADK